MRSSGAVFAEQCDVLCNGRLAVMTETLWTEKGLVSESAICV